MPLEIERRFLLANDSWRAMVLHSAPLKDGILALDNRRKVRVRIQDEQATLTIKGPRIGIVRDEFEYEIPLSDARALLARHCSGRIIEKTRHYIFYGEHEWHIDEFRGLLDGISLAEVELQTESTPLDVPTWIGREITGIAKYRQSTMIKARLRALSKVPAICAKIDALEKLP